MRNHSTRLLSAVLVATTLFATVVLSRQSSQPQFRSAPEQNVSLSEQDSSSKTPITNVDQIARRVDSLQFIVIYNADLLRSDLSSKVTWIYIMLGVMIVASATMFAALRQVQGGRKEVEERLNTQLATTINQLESQIKDVERMVHLYHPNPPPSRSTKKKK